ncbi:MAG: hypothetical protein LBU34_08395 [Planctomycetaceae bacterium]|jgi:hypothetical protein|nr:hypothetical protein [Planctomycetaceae bacterium]
MSAPQTPTNNYVSFDDIKELFKETGKQIKETGKQIKELKEKMKKSDKKIGELSHRIGDIIEAMVEGNIVQKFNDLNYPFSRYARYVEFFNKDIDVCGEIDFLLENDHIALLVEVKTHLLIQDVKDHIKRLEKYRRYLDASGKKYQLFAAAAGGVISQNVRDYVLKQGLFLLVQSGESFQLIKPPKEIQLRTW